MFLASSLLRQVLPVFTESLLDLVEKTLACMENKLLLIVKGAKQFFFLHMILALVKAKLWPDQAEALKKGAIDRIGVIAYSLLAHHSDGAANDAEGVSSSLVININQVTALTNVAGPQPGVRLRPDSARQHECKCQCL